MFVIWDNFKEESVGTNKQNGTKENGMDMSYN